MTQQDAQTPPNTQEAAELGLVQRLSPKLNGTQRRHLRALGHHLNPIVLVGQNGVTEGLIANMEAALLAHELIKVKVHDPDEVDDTAQALFEATKAQLAQKIGKTLLFYRAHPSEPKIVLPKVAKTASAANAATPAAKAPAKSAPKKNTKSKSQTKAKKRR